MEKKLSDAPWKLSWQSTIFKVKEKSKGITGIVKGFQWDSGVASKAAHWPPRGFPVQSFVVNFRVTLVVCNGRLAGSQDLQKNSIWLLMSVKGLLMNMLDSLPKTIINKLLKIQWKTGQGIWNHLRIWKTWEIHWRTVWNWMETQRMDFFLHNIRNWCHLLEHQ